MSYLDLTLIALGAAMAAALGPLLFVRETRPGRHIIGMADALAAGMMLGIAYPLMSAALARTASGAALGAAFGVVVTYLVHRHLGIATAPEPPEGGEDHSLLAATVHSAPEGVALGAAAALEPGLAIVLAATLAVHNLSESVVLAAHLPGGAIARVRMAGIGALTNVPQVVLAVATLALANRVPVLLPPLLGGAFGALTYLCLAELIPDSYGFTGRTSIAVVVIVAAGVVALATGSAA